MVFSQKSAPCEVARSGERFRMLKKTACGIDTYGIRVSAETSIVANKTGGEALFLRTVQNIDPG